MFKEIFKLQEETDGGDATSYVSGGAVAPATADQSDDGLDAAQWGALGESFDADESDESVTVEGDLAVERTEEKGEPPQPLESPVNPVTPVQSDQSAPVVPTATPTQIAAPETPTQPVAPPEVYQSWRVAREKELEGLYALNEEDAQAALTEPEKLLPKMAAKLHIGVLSLLFGLSQFTYKLNLWVYTFFVIGTVQFIIEGKRTSKDRISYKEYIKKIYKT
jgi:hypothetical protein